jgi:hypothetical protein
VTNLAKTQAQWTRFLGREFAGAFLAPIRELRELRDKFVRERVQVWNIGDRASATPHITALTFTGVNYGTNTNTEGRLYVRFVANGGNWDVTFYTAASASGAVAHVTNVAASSTTALTADNSSGLGGSITLGATITGDITDRHQVLIVQDYPARMPYIFTGVDSIEDDKFSRAAAEGAYATCAQKIQEAINALRVGVQKFMLTDPPGNPVGRGNEFNSTNATALSLDEAVPDQSSGNVSRRRTGLFPLIADNMSDEGTGGEQDVVRRVIAAGAGSFDADNSGQGTVASHTPREKTPVALWTFECVRGSDTGDLGREQFSGSAQVTDGSQEPAIFFSGLQVEKDWGGPRGLGSIRLRRTYSKTGDGSNLNLAAVTTGLFSGENNSNTDEGILYWLVESNASNWDFSFFKSSALTATTLVAKATNVATGAAINATAQNGSGLTVTWTAGSAPVDDTDGTVTCQPFLTENAAGKPDKFTITTSLTGTAGLIQELVGETFDAQLNSDTSGSESIPDNWAKQGTFFPFITQEN